VSRDDGNRLVDRSVPSDFANGRLPNLRLPLGREVAKVVETVGSLEKGCDDFGAFAELVPEGT